MLSVALESSLSIFSNLHISSSTVHWVRSTLDPETILRGLTFDLPVLQSLSSLFLSSSSALFSWVTSTAPHTSMFVRGASWGSRLARNSCRWGDAVLFTLDQELSYMKIITRKLGMQNRHVHTSIISSLSCPHIMISVYSIQQFMLNEILCALCYWLLESESTSFTFFLKYLCIYICIVSELTSYGQ